MTGPLKKEDDLPMTGKMRFTRAWVASSGARKSILADED